LTLSVPIQIKRRGGRKVVRLPDGNTLKPRPINDKPTPIQMALIRSVCRVVNPAEPDD
jgi:hypothetical protein